VLSTAVFDVFGALNVFYCSLLLTFCYFFDIEKEPTEPSRFPAAIHPAKRWFRPLEILLDFSCKPVVEK